METTRSSISNKSLPILNPVFDQEASLPATHLGHVTYPDVHRQTPGTVHVINARPIVQPVVLNGPRCPYCGMGILEPQFTLCGLLFALFFFPFGIILCFLLRENICTHCQLAFA